MITKCALAVITQHGNNVIPASISELAEEEEEFLSGHVDKLRRTKGDKDTRGRFREGSTLQADFVEAIGADDARFLAVANRLVEQLATAMRGSRSADCVFAFVIDQELGGAATANILKLDANVEAAELQRSGDVIRLRVYQHLLPKPGDMQKGISWPDSREQSEVIVLDTNTSGTAMYFQNAYRIDASPTARATEQALITEISALPPHVIPAAIEAVGAGGEGSQVVQRIHAVVPSYDAHAPELGGGGALAGMVRPNFAAARKVQFQADDIELKVPLDRLTQVSTKKVGLEYVTTIVTSVPLTYPDSE